MALFSISEFARATGLSVSALRFYDSVGLMAPAQVDETTGYRRYAENQREVAVLIRDLRRMEMPINAIRSFLAAGTTERHDMLDHHLGSLTNRLRDLEALVGSIRSSLTKEDSMNAMTVGAEELADAIDQVAPAAGSDPERPLLQSILVEARDGSLRLVATDSYRLAVRDLVARGGDSTSFRAMVAAARLVRARADLPNEGELHVSLVGELLRVTGPTVETDLRVMAAEYPNYEALFGSDPQASSFTAQRGQLGELVATMAGDERVTIELAGSGVSVEGQPIVVSEAWNGPEMIVSINPRFLHYAVSSAVGPEIRVEITTPLKPLLFKSATDGSFICLVMPIKID